MLFIIFSTISISIIIFGAFFILSGVIGFYRNKNFYMKVQCANLILIYGVTFVLFGLGIGSFDSTIFFKTLFLAILNLLISLAGIHALSRKAFLSDIRFDCNERTSEEEELIKEARKELKRQKLEEENKIKKEMEKKKEMQRLQEEELERQRQEEEERYRRENESLKEKIKEQKRKLREKIRKARMNARITRKQEEIDKTEDMIREILTKYNLTEEMLNEDLD